MSEKPNLPGLIEDWAHPDFKYELVDVDGIVWVALFEGGGPANWGAPIWQRSMLSAERFREIEAIGSR